MEKKPKVRKEGKRNVERRKEKSRNAARCRRSRETEIFCDLASALPLSTSIVSHLDKASIVRIAISYLKIRTVLLKSVADKCNSNNNTTIVISSNNIDDRLNITKSDDLNDDNSNDVNDDNDKKAWQKNLDSLFLSALEGFLVVISSEGDVIFISDNVQRYLGLSQVELLGQSIYELSHPCDHSEIRDILTPKDDFESDQKCFFSRMKCTLTNKSRNVNIKSATYKVIQYTGHLVKDHSNHPIPEKQRIEVEKSSEDKEDESDEETDDVEESSKKINDYEDKCSTSPLSYFIAIGEPVLHPVDIQIPLGQNTFLSKHSLDMKFTYADEKINDFFGYNPESMIKKSVFDYYHAQDTGIIRQSFKNLFQKGQSQTERYRFLALGGGYAWVLTQATLIYKDKGQKPHSVVCVNFLISGIEEKDRVYSLCQLEDSVTATARDKPDTVVIVADDTVTTPEVSGKVLSSTEDLPTSHFTVRKSRPRVVTSATVCSSARVKSNRDRYYREQLRRTLTDRLHDLTVSSKVLSDENDNTRKLSTSRSPVLSTITAATSYVDTVSSSVPARASSLVTVDNNSRCYLKKKKNLLKNKLPVTVDCFVLSPVATTTAATFVATDTDTTAVKTAVLNERSTENLELTEPRCGHQSMSVDGSTSICNRPTHISDRYNKSICENIEQDVKPVVAVATATVNCVSALKTEPTTDTNTTTTNANINTDTNITKDIIGHCFSDVVKDTTRQSVPIIEENSYSKEFISDRCQSATKFNSALIIEEQQQQSSYTKKFIFDRPSETTPKSNTSNVFVPIKEDMNKGFLTFIDDDDDTGVTILKDEPEDLTHLAPTAGDVCVPLHTENGPLSYILPDMLEEIMLSDCNLLSARVNDTSDHELSANHSPNSFFRYKDDELKDNDSTSRPVSPILSNCGEDSNLPSLSGGDSPLYLRDSSINSFLDFGLVTSDDIKDLSSKASYVPLSLDQDTLLPFITHDLMWGSSSTDSSNWSSLSNSPRSNCSLSPDQFDYNSSSSLAKLLKDNDRSPFHYDNENANFVKASVEIDNYIDDNNDNIHAIRNNNNNNNCRRDNDDNNDRNDYDGDDDSEDAHPMRKRQIHDSNVEDGDSKNKNNINNYVVGSNYTVNNGVFNIRKSNTNHNNKGIHSSSGNSSCNSSSRNTNHDNNTTTNITNHNAGNNLFKRRYANTNINNNGKKGHVNNNPNINKGVLKSGTDRKRSCNTSCSTLIGSKRAFCDGGYSKNGANDSNGGNGTGGKWKRMKEQQQRHQTNYPTTNAVGAVGGGDNGKDFNRNDCGSGGAVRFKQTDSVLMNLLVSGCDLNAGYVCINNSNNNNNNNNHNSINKHFASNSNHSNSNRNNVNGDNRNGSATSDCNHYNKNDIGGGQYNVLYRNSSYSHHRKMLPSSSHSLSFQLPMISYRAK